MSDKKTLRIITAATLTVLLLAMFLPGEYSGRFASAFLLLPISVVTLLFVKKRSILSMNKKEVLYLMIAFGVVYLLIYYLSGLALGFDKNIYTFNFQNTINFILPISIITVTSELIRYVVIAGEDKLSSVLICISCIVAEALIFGNIHYINSFNRFMDFVGITIFPAITANLLYHYLSRRYGAYPNIFFRLITTLYLYIIPYVPSMAKALFALFNLAVPFLIYIFLSALYERKRLYALGKKSKVGTILTIVLVILMIGTVMLISNQFRYGTLVVATPSMTGELNVGDAAMFEKYTDQTIVEGQVIVFEEENNMVIHRVVQIEKINNTTRYYTQGDANDVLDPGYRTDADIVGLVNFKIPYIGYPSLWLRSLFVD